MLQELAKKIPADYIEDTEEAGLKVESFMDATGLVAL